MIQSERGFTLLEILAALVILGFFTLAAGTFFTQTAMFANTVEGEVDRTNINQAMLYEAVRRESTVPINNSCALSFQSNAFFDFLEEDESGDWFIEGNNERLYPAVVKCRPTNMDYTVLTVGLYTDIEERVLVSEMHDLVVR